MTTNVDQGLSTNKQFQPKLLTYQKNASTHLMGVGTQDSSMINLRTKKNTYMHVITIHVELLVRRVNTFHAGTREKKTQAESPASERRVCTVL